MSPLQNKPCSATNDFHVNGMNYSTLMDGALLLSPAQIIETISIITDVSIPDILGSSRKKEKVKARQLCTYFIWKYLGRKREFGFEFTKEGLVYREIGEIMGYEKHATVIHCIKVIEDRSSTEKDYLALVDMIDWELKKIIFPPIVPK